MSSIHPSQEIPSSFPRYSPPTASELEDDTNFETNSTDSRDSKSRPLKVGTDSSALDSNLNPIDEPLCRETSDLRVSSATPSASHSGLLGGIRKSDSIDSTRATCCNQLAFNIYSKALESAKKALPKHRGKDSRHPQFPRSFGENFGSIGPEGFNYFDDSATECSGSYKDIDFNRDSYYLPGSEAIPEETEEQVDKRGIIMEEEGKPVITLRDISPEAQQQQSYDLSLDPSYYGNEVTEQDYTKSGSLEDVEHVEEDEPGNEGAKVTKKGSFIGRLFRKRDRSVEKKGGDKGKSKKASSQSRECSMEKSHQGLRGESLPLEDTERCLMEELGKRQSPSPSRDPNDDNLYLSNISRQSPVQIVYGRPPDIFVEECRTLPRNADELAAHTSSRILADALNQMNTGDEQPVSYANLDFSGEGLSSEVAEKSPNKSKKGKSPKKFFKKFGKGKTPEVEPQVEIQVTEPSENVPPEGEEGEQGEGAPVFQTEAELLEKPLPEVPTSGAKRDKSPTGKRRLFLKKDNFKLKDRFKNKKKQKEKMELYARRQLPTLPESRHSTLNSAGHVYDRIVSPELPRKREQDEWGNVIVDIGKPLEPGVDYFSPDYAPEETPEEEPSLTTLLQQQAQDLKASYESLEIPVWKPASPPPKVVHVEAKPEEEMAFNDPTAIQFDSSHPIIIGQIALFEKLENVAEKEIGVTYEPTATTAETADGDEPEPKATKMGKLKNMMGSLGQSVRAKVKDIKEKVKKPEGGEPKEKESLEKEYVFVDLPPMSLKETNLDEETSPTYQPGELEVQQSVSAFSFRTFTPAAEKAASSSPEPEIQITVEEVPSREVTYEVDADMDDEATVETPEKKKKVFRKFKLGRGKKEKVTVPDVEIEAQRDVLTPDRHSEAALEEETPPEGKSGWSARNKERIRRLRSRAAESFKEVKEKIAAKTKRKKTDARHDPDMYEYEFKFASDSEMTPGSGVESLRRQQVYTELAQAQERLELYMSPVGGHGPLRPPRSKRSIPNESASSFQVVHQSMPSLAMAGRRLPAPPRPPPPKLPTQGMHSYNSVPAIEVAAEDEISLSTSMSSIWASGRAASRSRSVRAARHQQRVPADSYYRNVRLGYRPKKSYIEMLEKSQMSFYSMANLANKCQSMGELPTPPNRKAKTLLSQRASRATTSPPPPNSRASYASNYGELPGPRSTVQAFYDVEEPIELDPDLLKEKELYAVYNTKYERPLSPAAKADPLTWEPFTWKVKRCRSLTEVDVRGETRQKQARCSVEPPERDPYRSSRAATPSEYGTIIEAQSTQPPATAKEGEETYSARIFSWLTSTTSLDTWRRAKRDRSMPAGTVGKPPRPPPPMAPLRARTSRPSSPTSAAQFFACPPSSHASRASSLATLTAHSLTAQSCSAAFAGRPLPPPPIPPRPKLIPAHYAIRPHVETRDAAVDTSENGFHEFSCAEKEVQVRLLSRPGSLASQDSRDSETLLSSSRPCRVHQETNLDEDEEATIVEEVRTAANQSQTTQSGQTQVLRPFGGQAGRLNSRDGEKEASPEPDTVTSATLYMDARSRLTDQETQSPALPLPNGANHAGAQFGGDGFSDDDTINDDISSFASDYQSLCSSLHAAPPVPLGVEVNSGSWLHRQPQPSLGQQVRPAEETNSLHLGEVVSGQAVSSLTNNTTDEYVTAMEGPSGPDLNRSSLISNEPLPGDEEVADLDYEMFRRQFAILDPTARSSLDEPTGESADNQRQASVDREDVVGATLGQESGTDSKRINRQSVISTVSSASSDTSSLFHTHSSSPTSSYSFDSSVSITSTNTAGAASSSVSTMARPSSSIFYVTPSAPLATSETTEEAPPTEEPEPTSGSLESAESVLSKEAADIVLMPPPLAPPTVGKGVIVNHNHQTLPENLSRLPTSTPKGAEPTKRYFLAHELFTTERDYVDVLRMLTEEFREAIRDAVSDYFLNKFFRPLDTVLPINLKLLSELETRVLTDWDDTPTIADIMISICPFFKEYSIFVREFEHLNHMLDEASEMFPNFREALLRFQSLERCKKLSIKNYLLKPIQRLPQYPLLLRGYFEKMKPDDPDYAQTEQALKVVTEVVEHINREHDNAEKAMILAELKNRIISKTPDSIVKPGRDLVKRGMLHKVSRKEVHERYFILFNDALLYLVPVMNEMLRLNEEFPLDGMEVEISSHNACEFVIRSTRRSFALMAREASQRQAWVEALETTIAEYEEKKTSFETARGHSAYSSIASGRTTSLSRRSSSPHRMGSVLEHEGSPGPASGDGSPKGAEKELHQQASIQSSQSSSSVIERLGERAPVWVHDHRVTMCQRCMRQFTLLFRRHHCRACGQVVCSDCSANHYPLKYRKYELQRVCDNCFDQLSTLHPEWADDHTKGGGGKNGSGSTRVSPNNSLSTADLDTIKRKNRSNSCTDLGNSFDWTNDVLNNSLPAAALQDQNHNPAALANSGFARGPARFSMPRKNIRKNIPAVLSEVPANDISCNQSGYMSRLTAKKSWKRYWFLIKDMVLYTFKASEDVAALETLPLPGFKVSTSRESVKGYPAKFIIELTHPGRSNIYFFTENTEAHERWLKAFRDCAELH